MSYKIGLSAGALVDASTVFGTDPASTYTPGGERVTTHAGGVVYVGYPRSVWKFTLIPTATYETAIQTTLAFPVGSYSKVVYIQTRDEFDDEAIYQALLRLPEPAELKRWGEKYTDVELEFVLLGAVV